jgi:hypothetical protein
VFDTTLGAAAASIDTGAVLPTTYAHMRIEVYARTDSATNGVDAINLRFNNDSAANYDFQLGTFSAATATASESFAATSAQGGLAVGGAAGANLFAVSVYEIAHYGGSANNKAVSGLASAKAGTTTGKMQVQPFGGFWRSSAAINRVTLIPSSGNFAAGTRVTVYVLGA